MPCKLSRADGLNRPRQHSDSEAESAEQTADGRFPTAEIPGSKHLLPRQEPMRYTDDGLRVIGSAVVNQQIRAGSIEAVLDEELVLAEPVVLGYRGQDRHTRDIPQPHVGA